ncbi:MAG: DUF4153 domain-containing protein [Paracoccaceae bacterium]|nr:DUF4153 domain-containing protein [Paracoccaceae bacterium]
MDQVARQRGLMTLIGALAGFSLYLMVEVMARHWLDDRLALGLTALAATFFVALLAITGPLSLRRAFSGAVMVSVAVALLLAWASLRYVRIEAFLAAPLPWIAGLVLGAVPLPFVIAAFGPGWRDYPTLFTQSWTIVVRYAAAWLFVAVVWALILLSDSLLGIVGLRVIDDLIKLEPMPFVITGLTLGFALAVVTDLADLVSPDLILRLLRLLLPVVALVMAVFIVALPFRGLSGLFGTLSAATTLLMMAAVAVTLVSSTIDQCDADATDSMLLMRATQALALILPVPAALGGYAVWLRVDQYGWTPDRVFVAVVAALALGYGVVYALAVLRGAGWMERIRQGNIGMALIVLAAAAAFLTPVLNPERIAANNQIARFEAGKMPPEALDLAGLARWGRAGVKALARLEEIAKQPGQQALAMHLQSLDKDLVKPGGDIEALRTALRAVLPMQPAGKNELRDLVLQGLDASDLAIWLESCRALLSDGGPGCVMVAGDFQPTTPGDEALVVLRDASGYGRHLGYAVQGGGAMAQTVTDAQGAFPHGDVAGLIARLQDAVPQLTPVPLNQLLIDGQGFIVRP